MHICPRCDDSGPCLPRPLWPFMMAYCPCCDEIIYVFGNTHYTLLYTGRHPGPVKLCVCFYETEHKYSLFTKCRRIFRLLWATTLSYWERATMAHSSDRVFICIFYYEIIVFWLKILRNLLRLVQLTTSQCWLKLWLSVRQRHAITRKMTA